MSCNSRRVKDVTLQTICISMCASAWQFTYSQSKWNTTGEIILGSLLTGLADSSVSTLFYLTPQIYQKIIKDRTQIISVSELTKTFCVYALIGSMWQPLVIGGAALGSQFKSNQKLYKGLYSGLFIFTGNLAIPSAINRMKLLKDLKPNPLFLAIVELCFFLTGPASLEYSPSGLNNRNIWYAAIFTLLGAVIYFLGEFTFEKCKNTHPQVVKVNPRKNDLNLRLIEAEKSPV